MVDRVESPRTGLFRRTLECDLCGARRRCTMLGLLVYARRGWPRCCGEVMAFRTAPRAVLGGREMTDTGQPGAEPLDNFGDAPERPRGSPVTPTDAVAATACDAPITFEIWRCYRANGSWVRAGRFATYDAALRAVPNRGRAPGWVVLPVWSRPPATPAG